MNILETGCFIISLDFELGWGFLDKTDWDQHYTQFKNVRLVIPRILQTFQKYGINATWATVGLIFYPSLQEAFQSLRETYPGYKDASLAFRNILTIVEQNESLFFAPDLVQLINNFPGQEIATHTFTHYYCMEDGQTVYDFEQDLDQAMKIARSRNIPYHSIAFPRDQLTEEYLGICRKKGIIAFRGYPPSWIYEPRPKRKETLPRRGLRLLDSYINISGNHTYGHENITTENTPLNVSSSMFLRPYSRKFPFFEFSKVRRIKKALREAAVNNKIFHLYWHPFNFGTNMAKNLDNLQAILDEFTFLNREFGIQSLNMKELADSVLPSTEGFMHPWE